ncbi:hypothetical protein FCOIX_289 [Fusarium coicis]|nr:hypothetical protein FCOIX_289 [Fusarium coicis]
MASFMRFSELPKELRDTIWDYATQLTNQRNLTGVQIFELWTPELERDGETSDSPTSDTLQPVQELAAPLRSKCFPALDGSPGNSKVFRYMADIGLWTACKESRDTMEKARRRTERNLGREPKNESRFNWEALPCTTLQPFKVQLHTDLFVLQPSNIKDIDWSQVACDIGKQFDHRDGWHGINIGIEWNVEWGIKKTDDAFQVLCNAFRNSDARLWIIDHNLKRKEDTKKKIDRWTEVFYTCDRKFFKVDWRYEPFERWRHVRPPPEETRYGRHECSTSLAKSLDSHGRHILYGHYGDEDDETFKWQVQLLGWDDL